MVELLVLSVGSANLEILYGVPLSNVEGPAGHIGAASRARDAAVRNSCLLNSDFEVRNLTGAETRG